MNTGKQATRLEQLLIPVLLVNKNDGDKIVIHHVTDRIHELQLEIERRNPIFGISFERIIL